MSPKLMLIFGMAVVSGVSQTPPAKKPSFDIVSIKPNKTGGPPRRIGTEGKRFIAENVPLMLLIQLAYRPLGAGLLREHVIGGASWLDSDRFDVEARVDADVRVIPTAQAWLMVQSLLEDRFQLRVRREARELPVYNLVVAKDGGKMKLSDDQTAENVDDDEEVPFDASTAPPPRGAITTIYTNSGETIIRGTAISITPNVSMRRPHALLPQGLTIVLGSYTGRPVIDKTNLKGLFDFRLQFTPERLLGNPDVTGLSIFTALLEQLGLKLESSSGPVDVIVIDSVERPSEN